MIDILSRDGETYVSVGDLKWRMRYISQHDQYVVIDALVKSLSDLDREAIIESLNDSKHFAQVELMTRYISVDVLEVLNTLNDWFDARITKQMVRDLLEDQGLFNEIAESGLDTVAREMCIEMLGKKVTGMRWPMNGDTQAYKDEFHSKWDKAMFEATGCNQDENYRGKCCKETYGCTLPHED